jgi:NADH dehydrogenase (ubiquinone) Fe-S protein 8
MLSISSKRTGSLLLTARAFATTRPSQLAHPSPQRDPIPAPTQTPDLPPFHFGASSSDTAPDFNYKEPSPKPIVYKDYSKGPSALDKAARLFFLTEIARGMLHFSLPENTASCSP